MDFLDTSMTCETNINEYIDQVLWDGLNNPTTTRILTFEDFPRYKRKDHMPCYRSIAEYFLQLLEAKEISPDSCVLFPSVHSMTKFFKAPMLEVLKAFKYLRTMGHDYMLPGYHGHISLWTA